MKKYYLALFMAAMTPLLMHAGELAENYERNTPTLYGYLLYDAETFTATTGGPVGIYSMNLTDNVTISPVNLELSANGGGCYADGKFFAIAYTAQYGAIKTCKLVTYNTTDWTVTSSVDASEKAIASTMTYNPADKQIYGCFFDNEVDKFVFGTLDTATGTPKPIKTLELAFRALAANANGTIYGIDENGDFYNYDPAKTDFVKIGATGLEPKNVQDATFDYGTKQLYWAALCDNASGIYTVNTQTGVATKIAEYATGEKEFASLYSTAPVYDGATPDVADKVQLSFNDETLTGSIKFAMPTVSYDGNQLSGTLKYAISIDGKEVASANSEAGKNIAENLVTTRGEHKITICISNEKGSGPEFNIHRYFGIDTPAAVSGFKATRSTGQISLTWNSVTEGEHKGLFYPEKIRYNITRQPDNVVIASSIAGTSYIDNSNITEIGSYYYEITATDGETCSKVTASNTVILGDAVNVPFSRDFRKRAGLGNFTVLDANGDGCTWFTRDNYGIVCMYSNTNNADDWLITPPLKLQKGLKYTVTASMAYAMEPYFEKFEIKYGTSPTPEGFSETIIEPTLLMDDYYYRNPMEAVGTFVPSQDGEYYIGIHSISDAGNMFLYCADFSISGGISTAIDEISENQTYIMTCNGGIDIVGTEGQAIDVYTVAGVRIASKQCSGNDHIDLAAGIYIVKVGNIARKVMIKD